MKIQSNDIRFVIYLFTHGSELSAQDRDITV